MIRLHSRVDAECSLSVPLTDPLRHEPLFAPRTRSSFRRPLGSHETGTETISLQYAIESWSKHCLAKVKV